MPLLRNGEFLDDSFITLDDDETAPEKGDIIVSWARLQGEFGRLKNRAGALGVTFPVTEDPAALAPYLDALALIALPFEAFTDGRGFSLARIVRARLGFRGELRAVGDILPDQIAPLRQVGFESFAPRTDSMPLDTWQRAATSMSLSYQTGFVPDRGFAPAEIFELRRQRRS